ncbi:two-component system sensor histidine kinase DegS [Geomicrobium halophilum]|uniref:Signal transduction histidine-protein kinase/phosphatase DegS n=1 Tax=Geomicrobium halophilum TaxID=549000 RepID=A0A841PNP7_9BACL|nr:sensor histidine kinase [Geomicrobium halophilum]MBB6450379.1 two-component system sensor histidine kinase DegS [Geomicrobium halophilum]
MNDKQTLEQIIEQMKETVRDSKEQIFEISEKTRQEYEELENELKEVRRKVNEVIQKTDEKQRQAQMSRNHLAQVSRKFQHLDSEKVQKAYDYANEKRVELALLQNDEKQLRERRDHIERRLIQLEDTMNRAEVLVGQVSVVHNFLDGDLREVGEIVEDAKEKQAFGLKIIQAQEEERKRVAREIHDGPAQLLANVLLRSELIERVYNNQGVAAALKEVQDVRGAIKSSLAEVRRIIYDLRPMALDDLGLIPTLKKYLGNLADQTQDKTDIRFILLGNDARMSPGLEVATFRLVQEAVQNAVNHAKAKQIIVKAEMRPSQVTLMINDDGCGFDINEVTENSFGLMGMRERVNMLKGDLHIDSTKGRGTKITIVVPLHETEIKDKK